MSAQFEAEFRAHYSYTIDGMVIAIVELSRLGKSRSAGAVANDLDNVLNEIQDQVGWLVTQWCTAIQWASRTEFAWIGTWPGCTS